MNTDRERYNMVEQQIRPCGVLDKHLLDLFAHYPREIFVPDNYKSLAFAETQISLGNGQIMLEPSLVGRILSNLKLTGTEHVLEVGTGSGYLTGLIALLCRSLTSVEIIRPFAVQASNRLASLGFNNVEVMCGNATSILKSKQAFDVVVLTGSVPYLPMSLTNQTKCGGRLFAITGTAPIMHACIFTRINEGEWNKNWLFETVVPPLKDIEYVSTFEF